MYSLILQLGCSLSSAVIYSLQTVPVVSIYHYFDVVMGAMAFLITSLTSVNSTVHPGADHRKHQSSVSLTFVRGIHRGPVNSPYKWPVTRKMFPLDDVLMRFCHSGWVTHWSLTPMDRLHAINDSLAGAGNQGGTFIFLPRISLKVSYEMAWGHHEIPHDHKSFLMEWNIPMNFYCLS